MGFGELARPQTGPISASWGLDDLLGFNHYYRGVLLSCGDYKELPADHGLLNFNCVYLPALFFLCVGYLVF